MTGNNSVVQDLFGISDCDLVSSQTVVENGKRCKIIHLEYSGNVPGKCPKCGEKTYSHGQRVLKFMDTPFGGLPHSSTSRSRVVAVPSAGTYGSRRSRT